MKPVGGGVFERDALDRRVEANTVSADLDRDVFRVKRSDRQLAVDRKLVARRQVEIGVDLDQAEHRGLGEPDPPIGQGPLHARELELFGRQRAQMRVISGLLDGRRRFRDVLEHELVGRTPFGRELELQLACRQV